MATAALHQYQIQNVEVKCSGLTGLDLQHHQKLARLFTESRQLQFRDETGNVTSLLVKPWHTMQEVREQLAVNLSPNKPNRVRLFCRGHELPYKKTVDSCQLRDHDVIHVSTRARDPSKKPKLEVLCGSTCPAALESILGAAREGLETGKSPELTPSGLGGTYFLRNQRNEVVGVFKPEDEEAGGPNNPRGHIGNMGCPSVRSGVLSGEANLREVAAFMLDHKKFANVPATVRVEVRHSIFGDRPKVGSFQEFKLHDEEAGDLSSSLFSQEEAHKIAIMDIRLLNTDRNDENLLVRRHQNNILELIPIDHGCSLPSTLQVNWHDWIWLSWPQTKRPFSESEKEYIASLDATSDSQALASELNLGWRNLLMLTITTTFLQKGAEAGLTLFDIASMMARDDTSQPSTLESIFTQSRALASTKKGGSGGLMPRRSPAITAVKARSPPEVSPSSRNQKKGIRRSTSSIDLSQLSFFSLPPSEVKRTTIKARDDHAWDAAEEEQQQESFDSVFFECMHELMDSVIKQRLSKKRALSIMANAFKSSPQKKASCHKDDDDEPCNVLSYVAARLCKNGSEDFPKPLQPRFNLDQLCKHEKRN